jgi:hypothetical protein
MTKPRIDCKYYKNGFCKHPDKVVKFFWFKLKVNCIKAKNLWLECKQQEKFFKPPIFSSKQRR